jgi:hypothetical protein
VPALSGACVCRRLLAGIAGSYPAGIMDVCIAYTVGNDPIPILQEVAWAPRSVSMGAENLASTGIRSPDLLVNNVAYLKF